MWSFPYNNLTLVIETKHTPLREPFFINIENSEMKEFPFRIYRIQGTSETEIKSVTNTILQNSDQNFQVILKIQASSTHFFFEFPFIYSVHKK